MDDIAAKLVSHGDIEDTSEDIGNDFDHTGESDESQKNLTNVNSYKKEDESETDRNKIEELLGSHIEEINVEENNAVAVTASDDIDYCVKAEIVEEVEAVKEVVTTKASGRCCKLLFLAIFSTAWLTFLTYCYLYLSTVCVPVEVRLTC